MDKLEFEQIFRTHFNYLRNIAFGVVHDLDTAGDITQQVFLNLWQKKDKLEIQGNVKSYIQRAVINESINYLKKQKKLYYPENIEAFDTFDAPVIDLEREKLIEKSVFEAVDKLSPKCRLVFSLSRFSKMPNKEIAEHLNISVKAVEKNMGKALNELRVSLKPLYKSMCLLILILFMVGFFNVLLS